MNESLDTFNDLRQAILDKITSEETTIHTAYFEQRSEFEGSPVAVIGVSQNEALYNSSGADKMVFVFQIMIYIPLKENDDAHEVEINMGRAYWEVLRMFSARGCLGSAADFVEPTPSVWGFEERGSGIYRFAEINLRCVKYLSNIKKAGS
jgi:hypothetical protein